MFGNGESGGVDASGPSAELHATGDLIVGRVPFLVCAPFFHASLMGMEGIRFVDGPPRLLNGMLAQGSVQCAPSSSFEYAQRHGSYLLLPGLSTSSRWEMKSVLFLSRHPWEEMTGRKVDLSPDSSTSNMLFRLLAKRLYAVEPLLENPAVEAEGVVVIGDRALHESQSGRWPYRYDLAGEWHRWQGLPFSFGLWILRADASQHPALPRLLTSLYESLEAFRSDPRSALSAWSARYSSGFDWTTMTDFFSTADYSFTPAHEESLRRFFRCAWEDGFLEEEPRFRYFEP